MASISIERDPLSLSQRINAANRDGHDRVNFMIMDRLPLGLKDYRHYREGLLTFYHIYAAFESAWTFLLTHRPSNISPPIYKSLQNLWIPEIARTPQLFKDLQYFYGSIPFSMEPDTVERKAYTNHIKQVIREKPHVLIAYAHNYYMALFAGGKRLRYLVQHATEDFFPIREGVEEIEKRRRMGTGLFTFEGIEKGQEEKLRGRFKEVMGEINNVLSEVEKKDIIEESQIIFTNNERVIKELDEICAKEAVRVAYRESLESGAVAKFTAVLVTLLAVLFVGYHREGVNVFFSGFPGAST